MSDELPTAARVSDPGIRALYRQENRWQAWLDVEAALAKAQAELGIIPRAAAEAIGRAAHFELLDRARIDEGFARTGHTIVPLVWELARVVGEPHGGWVHWGATTQNITQTGDLLVLRQAHGIFFALIADALDAAAAMMSWHSLGLRFCGIVELPTVPGGTGSSTSPNSVFIRV